MIREKIQSEMKLQKIKPGALATKTGMTQAQMSNFMSGKQGVNLKTLEAIFEALNIQLIRII